MHLDFIVKQVLSRLNVMFQMFLAMLPKNLQYTTVTDKFLDQISYFFQIYDIIENCICYVNTCEYLKHSSKATLFCCTVTNCFIVHQVKYYTYSTNCFVQLCIVKCEFESKECMLLVLLWCSHSHVLARFRGGAKRAFKWLIFCFELSFFILNTVLIRKQGILCD